MELQLRPRYYRDQLEPIRQAGGSRRVIVVPVASRESKGNDELYQSWAAT
jgi:hypothetical protein